MAARVSRALEVLLRAVQRGYRRAGKDPFETASQPHELGEQLHEQALRLLLQLTFAALAEERGFPAATDSNTPSLGQVHAELHASNASFVDEANPRAESAAFGGWSKLCRVIDSLRRYQPSDGHPQSTLLGAEATRLVDGRAIHHTRGRWIDDGSLLVILDALFGGRGAQPCEPQRLGSVYEAAMGGRVVRLESGEWQLSLGTARRSSGSHYTPADLTRDVVEQALRPHFHGRKRTTSEQLLALRLCDPAMGCGAFLLEACRQLAERLVNSWQTSQSPQRQLPHTRQLQLARAAVARQCLYGVDVNPQATELARMSLWLFCADPKLPISFLDHALKTGNSLVAMTRRQLAATHWAPPSTCPNAQLDEALGNAAKRRHTARTGPLPVTSELAASRRSETASKAELGRWSKRAEQLHALFQEHKNARARNNARKNLAEQPLLPTTELNGEQAPSRRPFHWPLAFPEVFERPGAGFDVIVGNPPFLGGKRISTAHGDGFAGWLRAIHQSSKNVDLAAHFLRRAAQLVGPAGTIALITTNTLPQGATRRDGLQKLLADGFSIYHAVRSQSWPGAAAVKISVVCLAHPARRRSTLTPKVLDQKPVDHINSLLRSGLELNDPDRLSNNRGLCFIGCFLRGTGFVLDAPAGAALRCDDALKKVVRPFLGGEEVNHSPTHRPHRYVVDFGTLPLSDAERYDKALSLVREQVKPVRDALRDSGVDRGHKRRWWQFANPRPELRSAISGLQRCLVAPRVTKHLTFAFLPTDRVFSDQLCVFASDDYAHFAVLQSRLHDAWVRRYASTLGEGLRYTPSDCVETFALPYLNGAAGPNRLPQSLRDAGQRLYHERSQLLVARNEGLTKLYNALRDPKADDPALLRLRYLHEQLDELVLESYGWTDIRPAPYARGKAASAEQAFYQTLVERLHQLNQRVAKAS